MNRKMHNQGVRFALACLLLIFGIAWGSSAQADVTYSGRAFGAFVDVNLLGVTGQQTFSDTGDLPPGGGVLTNQLDTVSIDGVLNATIMPTMTSGANGVARSEASLAGLMLLPGNAAA